MIIHDMLVILGTLFYVFLIMVVLVIALGGSGRRGGNISPKDN